MAIEIITKSDLNDFRDQLVHDLRTIIQEKRPEEGKRWLKSDEVRQLLNVSTGTLQNLRINGTLTYSKIGGTLFYDSLNIDKILRANKVEAKNDLFTKV